MSIIIVGFSLVVRLVLFLTVTVFTTHTTPKSKELLVHEVEDTSTWLGLAVVGLIGLGSMLNQQRVVLMEEIGIYELTRSLPVRDLQIGPISKALSTLWDSCNLDKLSRSQQENLLESYTLMCITMMQFEASFFMRNPDLVKAIRPMPSLNINRFTDSEILSSDNTCLEPKTIATTQDVKRHKLILTDSVILDIMLKSPSNNLTVLCYRVDQIERNCTDLRKLFFSRFKKDTYTSEEKELQLTEKLSKLIDQSERLTSLYMDIRDQRSGPNKQLMRHKLLQWSSIFLAFKLDLMSIVLNSLNQTDGGEFNEQIDDKKFNEQLRIAYEQADKIVCKQAEYFVTQGVYEDLFSPEFMSSMGQPNGFFQKVRGLISKDPKQNVELKTTMIFADRVVENKILKTKQTVILAKQYELDETYQTIIYQCAAARICANFQNMVQIMLDIYADPNLGLRLDEVSDKERLKLKTAKMKELLRSMYERSLTKAGVDSVIQCELIDETNPIVLLERVIGSTRITVSMHRKEPIRSH